MKRYIVHDRQGGDFMGWTRERPQTIQQIMGYLYDMANDQNADYGDRWTWQNFRYNFKGLEFCAEWGVELEEAKL